MGVWLKDQKKKRRAEVRTCNAGMYAATLVVGVVVAAIVASTIFPPDGSRTSSGLKITTAIASAAVNHPCSNILTIGLDSLSLRVL